MLDSLCVWDVDFRFGAAGTDTGFGALRHPRLVSAGYPYNAAGFDLTHDEFVPIPASGQPKRSHPIRVPGDKITPRIRRCHVPNKYILITPAVGHLLLRSFWTNEAIFQLMMLAYNLFLLFKMDFAGETEYRQQIKTFRLKYIFLAGKIIRTARSVVMKLSEKYPYRELYEKGYS